MENHSEEKKPQSVVTAVNLLWASLAVGLVVMLMDFQNLTGVAPAVVTNLILITSYALFAFLIFKISARKNWARITFLVLFIFGLLPTLHIVVDDFIPSAVLGGLTVTQIGIQGYAFFLLFTHPSRGWFSKDVAV